jgi:nicotinamidase-related amidase
LDRIEQKRTRTTILTMSLVSDQIAEILAQPRPGVQTQQALVILGLQNDFISPDAKLPVSIESGFVDRIREIVPKFRDLVGDIIWVRSEFDAERKDGSETSEVILDDAGDQFGVEEVAEATANESNSNEPIVTSTPTSGHRSKTSKSKRKKAMKMFKDMGKQKPKPPQIASEAASPDTIPVTHEEFVREEEELFLASSKKGPCCLPGTVGAEFAQAIQSSIDAATDRVVVKSHYSAFNGTSLLVSLRMKLITELYVCGCMSNVSVYATTLDAARHGFKINIIEDCLGYRTTSRHDTAINTMVEHMGAQIITSEKILEDLNAPPEERTKRQTENEKENADALGRMLGGLKLEETSQKSPASPSDSSLALLAESLDSMSIAAGQKSESKAKASKDDEHAAETPTKTLQSQRSRSEVAGKQYVKTRIRVRPKDKSVDASSKSPSTKQNAAKRDVAGVTEVSQVCPEVTAGADTYIFLSFYQLRLPIHPCHAVAEDGQNGCVC